MKISLPLLLLILLVLPPLAWADPYALELLQADLTSSSPEAAYLSSFPHREGQKNLKGESFLTGYPSLYVNKKGKKFFSDCLLRNTERWNPTYIYGLNETGDLLVSLTHRDTSDSALGILRATGEAVQSYCPTVTWDINKTCREKLLFNSFGIDGDDPSVHFNNGVLSFPVTTARNLSMDYRGGEGPYLTAEAKKNPYCTFRITMRSPDGKPMSNQSFLLFGRAFNKSDAVLGATRTDRRGSAKLTINLQSFVQKTFPGACSGVTLRAQTPFLNDKWLSRGISMTIWDHCI